MKRPVTKPARVANAPSNRPHAFRVNGTQNVAVVCDPGLHVCVTAQLESGETAGETERDLTAAQWYLRATEEEHGSVLLPGEIADYHAGIHLSIGQSFQLYPEGKNDPTGPAFDRILTVGDLRAFFIGLQTLRERLQAHGLDV